MGGALREPNYVQSPSRSEHVDAESPGTGGAASSTDPALAIVPGDKPSRPLPDPSAEGQTQNVATGELKPATEELEAKDLFVGCLSKAPWQCQGGSSYSATWLAAAQRRHSRRRRTNSLLGVGSADLSGPREPTPTPGAKVGQRQAQYYVVLTFALDHRVGHNATATQADTE